MRSSSTTSQSPPEPSPKWPNAWLRAGSDRSAPRSPTAYSPGSPCSGWMRARSRSCTSPTPWRVNRSNCPARYRWCRLLRCSPRRSGESTPGRASACCSTSADQLRQLAHVAEDSGARTVEPVCGGEPAGVAERTHAGTPGRGHSGPAVFDYDTARRLDAQLLGRMQEQVGCRLPVRHLAGAEDPPLEPRVEPGQTKRERHLVVASAGGNTGLGVDPVERLDDAVDRAELGRQRLPVAQRRLLRPAGRQLPPDMRLDLLDHVLVGPAEEPFGDLRLGQLPAQLGKEGHLQADRDLFAVHEHAVAVEDH